MGPSVLRVVYHVRSGVRDESEAAGALGLGVLHDDDVDDLAPLFEVLAERFVGGAVVEAADEELAELFRLGFHVLRNSRTVMLK